MSVRLTLICHAATSATREPAFPLDEPIETAGIATAAALAGRLRRVDAAWTSPSRRAVQTAEALGLAPTLDHSLRDMDAGAWAGRALADVAATDPAGIAAWTADPAASPHGGESVVEILARVAAWLAAMVDREGRIVAVTHPAILRAAIVTTLDAPPPAFWRIDIEPLAFLRLQGRAGNWSLRSLTPP